MLGSDEPIHLRSSVAPSQTPSAQTSVPIRPAVSVLMLRQRDSSDDALEVFVQHRVRTMDFAAGVVVFPGGRVDPVDQEAATRLESRHELRSVFAAHRAGWQRTASAASGPHAEVLAATAVREVFEESGAELSPESLLPWANWITPPGPPKRFDTYFFVSDCTSITARHQTTEAHLSEWAAVSDVLTAHERGELKLMTPTRHLLTELHELGSVDTVLGHAATRTVEPVRRDRPGPRDYIPTPEGRRRSAC